MHTIPKQMRELARALMRAESGPRSSRELLSKEVIERLLNWADKLDEQEKPSPNADKAATP